MFIAFLLVGVGTIISCMVLLNQMVLTVEKKEEANEPTANKGKLVAKLFMSYHNFIFLLTWFVVGTCNMVLAGYLFLLMRDQMHASKSLMGICTLVQSFVQLLIFPFA